jgi:hypothetical protein
MDEADLQAIGEVQQHVNSASAQAARAGHWSRRK